MSVTYAKLEALHPHVTPHGLVWMQALAQAKLSRSSRIQPIGNMLLTSALVYYLKNIFVVYKVQISLGWQNCGVFFS